jgi:hypothetical protein
VAGDDAADRAQRQAQFGAKARAAAALAPIAPELQPDEHQDRADAQTCGRLQGEQPPGNPAGLGPGQQLEQGRRGHAADAEHRPAHAPASQAPARASGPAFTRSGRP